VVETELILSNLNTLADGLIHMLLEDKYEDLSLMYRLFRRVDGGLHLMRLLMSDHIKEIGKQQDPENSKPVEFVQKMLDQRDKYDRIVTRSFFNDSTFRNALNQSFEFFVNISTRSPEFISLFIDDLLRKTDTDIVESLLDKVVALFRHLQDKDIFEKFYKHHLSKRLLSGRQVVSHDVERLMLIKLKTECGYQFTSKLEAMFTDIKTSKDMMDEFRRQSMPDQYVDMHVNVLTTGSWPQTQQSVSKCNLPRELELCCETFRTFYLSAHSGRRLIWQTNMGTADLRASFGAKRHELSVSTHQMCILMLFNEVDTLSYREISDVTLIPATDLKLCLQSLSLVKGKNVLRKEPMGKEILESDVFHFNDKFNSKMFKIKVGMVAAKKEEKEETRHKVEEDRKPQIDAAIVRIMKARRVLDHNSVVREITTQLAPRFLASPSVIKKRIERLIEREFLERDADDRKMYRYMA
jgi:cullin 3